jgi:hypothetical protein
MSASQSNTNSDDEMSVCEVEEVKLEEAGVDDPSTWSARSLQQKLDLRAARCSAAILHPGLKETVLLLGLKFELVRETTIIYELSSISVAD